jgi:hypothetical protein
MTLTDEDKHWMKAAMEDSSKRFGYQFTNLIQRLEREMVAGWETVKRPSGSADGPAEASDDALRDCAAMERWHG